MKHIWTDEEIAELLVPHGRSLPIIAQLREVIVQLQDEIATMRETEEMQ